MSFTGTKINRQDSQESKEGHDGTSCSCSRDKNLSMSSLIMWNISKALERCPSIDLKSAMRAAHSELERESRDGAPMLSLPPEEQHLTCALLAWHQLGHRNVDSLCEFVEANQNNTLHINANSNIKVVTPSSQIVRESAIGRSSFELNSLKGPSTKLPMQETILLRVGSFQSNLGSKLKKGAKYNDDAKRKISAACCLDSACIAKLTELDKETNELRTRAGKLAKREATRIEILERAEAAWKDLEVSYQRRLNLAEEKEGDIEKEIKRILEERNEHKNICKTLTDELRKQCAEAEEIRDRLGKLEEEVCCRACTRLQLNEESDRGDSALAEQHCRITQVDRDLQLKEEQARRKILTLEGEVESVRGLTLEVERATRADLGIIKDNVKKVTDEANKEEKENNLMKAEVEKLRKNKNEMMEDLETCKIKCDKGMTGKIDELKSKKQKLIELKGKVLDCRCRIPLDVSVEAKRTPSLAVLCTCAEDDQVISESCSCTSLRNQLMSNLLGDLFGGLQSELGDSGSLMPCHLLKCLEDKHNWDRASDVKSNLGDYFSQLLVGELQIAIATSIEKYHAQWIGASCADEASYRRRLKNDQTRQERDMEQQAQVLATELAEKLFEERADELTKKAKEIFSSGPPPCECKPQQEAVYRCLVKAPTTRKAPEASSFKRTLNDVTQLRAQLEDLRKESVKKEDLRHMEDKLKRILHRASRLENNKSKNKKKLDDIINTGVIDKPEYKKVAESANCDKAVIKLNDSSYIKNNTKITSRDKTGRIKKHTTKKDVFKKIEQSYAVNVCFCKNQQISNVLKVSHKSKKRSADTSSSKQIKPINLSHNSDKIVIENIDKIPGQISCPNDCTCFHKVPSNTSINKLLKSLTCCSFLNQCNEKTKTAEIENTLKTTDNNSIVNSNITFKDSNSINKSTNSNKKFDSTVSEYMGTVNFDKSNEKICKCVICKSNQKNEIVLTHSPKENKENIFQNEKDTHYPETSSRNFLQSNEQDVNIYGESYISDMMKNSQMFSDACNYCVKLLGVTLADTSNNQSSRDLNSVDASRSGTSNGTKCNLSTCKYGSVLESKFLADTTKSKEKISNVNKDQKSCICCNNQLNTSDIEMNTFNLLEEHLKEKIKDVKQNFNFSIPADEEQKIYANILEKVKRLITDNTSELSCKCLFENEKGSWSRACGLLKEYLKIKIKRAQCSCAGNNLADTILPTVLDKVNALIENDFDRLKIKYNGELLNGSSNAISKKSNDESRNGNYSEPNIQSPYKFEPQHAKNKSVKINDNVSAQVSINFNSQEKSCDPIYDMENEDNAIKKSLSGFENSVYVTDCDCRLTYVTKSDESAKNNNTKASIQYENFNKRNPLAAGNGNNYLNTFSDTLALKPPYVGYTINCSCDHSLGPCVCNKSVVNAKKEQINDIWQSITSQSFPKDLTYIMRKNPISSVSEEIPGNERENEKYSIEKSHNDVCKNTNTDYHTNIALKDSSYKNNKTYRDSGTFDATKAETIKQKVPIDCFIRPENPLDRTEEYIGTCSCDCESVPICHVKMLVDDIKQKLMYSECICDPLSEEVCPLHSKKC